jgi:hypothetical protein
MNPTAPVAMMIGAASVGFVMMAGVRAAHDLAQKEQRRLGSHRVELRREIEKLEVSVEELLAHERIQREARRRGMVYPRADQILGTVAAVPAGKPK